MENKTVYIFFGPDVFDMDRLGGCACWAIENLISDHEVNCFLFGSGGDFERVCYRYILESRSHNNNLIIETSPCDDMCDLESLIDKSDYCIFSKCVGENRSYVCEGVKINVVGDKLDALLRYAQSKNKIIVYI